MSASPLDRLNLLRCVLGIFGLCLLGVSWRLWISPGSFPAIPWFGPVVDLPPVVDLVALLLVVVGLLCWTLSFTDFGPLSPVPSSLSFSRVGDIVLSLAWPLTLILDQHRLQPWAWELCFTAWLFTLARPAQAVICLRLFIASIYFHSACSKFDASFFESQGPMFLDGLSHVFGFQLAWWPKTLQKMMPWTFPMGELFVALTLLHPKTRKLGWIGSLVMHGLLLLILGPWGLNHRPGVLVWYLSFMVLNPLLFGELGTGDRGPGTGEEGTEDGSSPLAARRSPFPPVPSSLLTAFALLVPFLEPWSLWDHWPSWAVYSGRPSVVKIYVKESRVAALAPELQRCLAPAEPLEDWRRISLEQWSFEQLNVPLYPQARYRLALALAVADQSDCGEDLKVEIASPPARCTGQRQLRRLFGTEALRAELQRYFVNVRPRWGRGTKE